VRRLVTMEDAISRASDPDELRQMIANGGAVASGTAQRRA